MAKLNLSVRYVATCIDPYEDEKIKKVVCFGHAVELSQRNVRDWQIHPQIDDFNQAGDMRTTTCEMEDCTKNPVRDRP